MIFEKQKIQNLYRRKAEPYQDTRGYLNRSYCKDKLTKKNIDFKDIKQINISFNEASKTLRGFHYQIKPSLEKKIISCISGAVHNIVVDLRENSSTYLKWQSFTLSESNKFSLIIPDGCANAFITTAIKTKVLYFHSDFYNPEYSKSFYYNDPYFNFDWPYAPDVISEKDKTALLFSQIVKE